MSAQTVLTERRVDPLTSTDIETGSVARLRHVITTQPGALAVHDAELRLTYGDLGLRLAAVRRQVRAAAAGSPSDRPIALLYSHGAAAVAALWGVITSGHPVLVLDPRTPAARLRAFAERVDVHLCLTDQANAATAAELVEQVVVDASAEICGTEADLEDLWATAPAPTDAAAYAFTSGSTGRPKVVVNDHRMLVRDAWANARATDCYGADDVVGHTLPMAFHAGLMATCAGVLVGTTMAMYDIRTLGIDGLPAWIDANQVTIVQASPAILRNFVGIAPAPEQLRRLTSVTIAGEAAYGPDIEAARALLPPGCVIRNRYGSSETSLLTEYQVDDAHPPLDGLLPVGRPIPDVELTLVDEAGIPVPAGGSGTVTLTGRNFAIGYLGDAAATDAVFTPAGDGLRTYRSSDVGTLGTDGALRLLGRRDHSVKIRGYLVEPGEVDAALSALDDVRESLTIGAEKSGDSGGKRLVSYIVSTAERPAAAPVRQQLAEVLPSYMVPESIVFLEALPRTDRGKLDRAGLPQPPTVTAGATKEELTEWQSVVHALWCSVLALPEISLADDFFELGGDSLAAESLMTRMQTDLGVAAAEAQTTVLVQAPTLGEFAERVTRKVDAANQTLIPLRPTGSRPPLFLMTGGGGLGVTLVPLMRRLPDDQPVFALQAFGLEARGIPDWSVEASARRHIKALRQIQPYGPYFIGGHSFGGVVAVEVAHQLRDAGHEVGLLVVLDSFPPDRKSHAGSEGSLVQRLKTAAGVATTGLRGTPGDDQYWRFWRQSNYLHRLYKGKPYDGETLVIVAADSDEKEERRAWAPFLTGTWRLTHVPGDHLSILRDPYAGRTAELIREALEPAQEKQYDTTRRPKDETRPRLFRRGKAWPDQY
ncbi:AMP-binding protein [Kineosporia succinea]|uniref:Acyl-coenzyme A synthetase/AMP-(Fatty) acid ligase/thioesterase domain-containing protein n=1 Tax=Kineosporia succinea TaxID=84632 RepID=A0ABT9P5X7_9ACTN|nr:AMP-binding protein [Kineosporia succinea]MDP9828083.1 acyl-coenzyme A synthetase/AMP-(fatty) acid ligase/thioesterase domain-containing protein [Kineosporia succinea]